MKTKKLIFIEGLPGSGKTTFAKRLYEYLQDQETVQVFNEGLHNPLSLAWQGIFNDEEYNTLLNKYPSLHDEIINHTIMQMEHHIVAYTRINVPEELKDFYEYAKKHEVYKEDKEEFLSKYNNLYKEFKTNHDCLNTSYIFECALLQNHVNQMLAVYHTSEEEVVKHIQNLTEYLKPFNPMIIHIKQKNIANVLQRISNERKSHNKNIVADWIDLAIDYIENTPYGKKNNLQGKEGLQAYFKTRQDLEQKVLQELDIAYKVIDLEDDYDAVFTEIKKVVEST